MRRAYQIAIFLLAAAILILVPPIGAQEFGANWTATYYNTPDLTGPVVATQIGLPGVNFNYGAQSPVAGAVNNDNFSVRFTTTHTFEAGIYDFIVSADDGVRVIIDGTALLDEFIARPLTTNTFQAQLTAGPHNLTVEYFEATDQASISVQWFLSTTEGILGAPTPVPVSLTATVSGVNGLALRTGPYLGASMITVIRPGTGYPVLAHNNDEGVFTWYRLQVDNREGWSSGRFLTLNQENTSGVDGSVFDSLGDRGDTGAFAIPRAFMNLRRRPSIRTQRIGQVPWGAVVPLLGRTVQGGQNHWLLVSYEGQVGWIFAPFVTVRGNLSAVPVH